MDYEKETLFGAFDSELMHQEITIPEGFTATIDGDKIILTRKESEDDMVRKCLINGMKFYYEDNEEATWGTEKFSMKVKDILSWLEKQGEQKSQRMISAEAKEAMYSKPATWSEEDEKFFKTALWHISDSISNGESTDIHCDTTEWLKSLKQRIGG